MAAPQGMMMNGADPRLEMHDEKILDAMHFDEGQYVKPQFRKLHDNSVKFEEYYHYSRLTRAEEDLMNARDEQEGKSTGGGFLSTLFPTKNNAGAATTAAAERQGSLVNEKLNLADPQAMMQITDEEWKNASRALRTASASAIFYLITTDILGPFGLPYAFASMGYGPGIALFTVFAALAGYSGYLLWDCYLGLDSYEYPLRNYGDMGYRLYGSWCRHMFNVLQALQLILNVGLIVISNGEALSQAAKFRLCFAVCCVVWAVAGFVIGQVRTLQKFGWLANAAVWINLACMAITMGAAATTAPNYLGAAESAGAAINGGASITPNAAGVYPAVQHYAGLPPSGGFAGSVNGAMQAVFSYGGAMIFPEFMAEMRNPKRDFLKGMWSAQIFIYVVYMLYGLFMYAYQGQYVINPSYLGISAYGLQTVGNVFAMVSALIAAALYGNIGIKVLYNNILVELFRAPPLTTKAGKFVWVGLVPIFWAIAFVIASGIPDFSGLTGVVAAICILNFTYTFPPMLAVAYAVKRFALREGEGFDPRTGKIIKHDTGIKRFMRGFMGKRWYLNVFNILYMLGALCLSALGAYGSIVNLMAAFGSGTTNSFVCHSPLQ